MDDSFDYVVVGAGSAGCALAARLSADPTTRVALVEAGGPDRHPAVQAPMDLFGLFGSELDWAFTTEAQSGLGGRTVAWPRGRTLGGSSTINFQMWVPGHRDDFGPWGEHWAWDAVEPYFRAVEQWAGDPANGGGFGTSGPLYISPPRDPDPHTSRFLDACAELGLKEIDGGFGAGDPTGAAMTPLNQLRGARWSAADGYLRPVSDRSNLLVVTGAHVHRVSVEHGRATGVVLGDRTLLASREVVLSAGAVGSPHLLLLSGIGPAAELRDVGIDPLVDLPAVGRNLRDHMSVSLTMSAGGEFRLVDADTEASRLRYAEQRLGPLTSNMAEAVCFLRADEGPGAPDVEIIFTPVGFGPEGPVPGVGLTVVPLQPESQGRIRLRSADPNDPPVIDPAYLDADADLPMFVRALRHAERLFETAALRPMLEKPLPPWPGRIDDDALADVVRNQATTMFHPVGTCRLGPEDDEIAVVDPLLRVRGVERLRVADASVVPALPRGHTHAVAAMVAERAAGFITDDVQT